MTPPPRRSHEPKPPRLCGHGFEKSRLVIIGTPSRSEATARQARSGGGGIRGVAPPSGYRETLHALRRPGRRRRGRDRARGARARERAIEVGSSDAARASEVESGERRARAGGRKRRRVPGLHHDLIEAPTSTPEPGGRRREAKTVCRGSPSRRRGSAAGLARFGNGWRPRPRRRRGGAPAPAPRPGSAAAMQAKAREDTRRRSRAARHVDLEPPHTARTATKGAGASFS